MRKIDYRDLQYQVSRMNDRSTLIIFDWDDTLLPSTWLHKLGVLYTVEPALTEEVKEVLANISESVLTVLRQAQMHGLLIIVTNGEAGWVESSCRRFMPAAASLMDTIPIISARTMNRIFSESPVEWKRMTFHDEVGPANNVVSIGDSECERQAVATLVRPGRIVKSLKLEEKPDPEKLLQQLGMISKIMDGIVLHTANMDIVCSSLEAKQEEREGPNTELPCLNPDSYA